MVSDIAYRIHDASVFITDCIFEVLKPTLVVIFFIIFTILTTFLSPFYIFFLLIYNTKIYIQNWFIRRRYLRVRAENDELLHDLLEEKHLINIVREYADDEVNNI